MSAPVRAGARSLFGQFRRRFRRIGRAFLRGDRGRDRAGSVGRPCRPRPHAPVRSRHPDPGVLHHQGRGGPDVRLERRPGSVWPTTSPPPSCGRISPRPARPDSRSSRCCRTRPGCAACAEPMDPDCWFDWDAMSAQLADDPAVAAGYGQRLPPGHLRLSGRARFSAASTAAPLAAACGRMSPSRSAWTCGSACRRPSTTASPRCGGRRRLPDLGELTEPKRAGLPAALVRRPSRDLRRWRRSGDSLGQRPRHGRGPGAG